MCFNMIRLRRMCQAISEFFDLLRFFVCATSDLKGRVKFSYIIDHKKPYL